MQTINFQPLGFEGIPQHEMQARQRYYDAVTKPWSEFGNIVSNAAGKVGDAMYRRAQDDKSEEWRRRQWENQLDQQRFSREQTELQNRRYDEELRRTLAEKQADRDATEALRRDFLRQYGYGYGYNLDKYGLPGQFAMSRIRNARNWQDMVGAGQALAQHIQMQDMLEAQRAEQEASKFGPRESNQVAAELAMEGFDLRDPESSAARIRGDYYDLEDAAYNLSKKWNRLRSIAAQGRGDQQLYDQMNSIQRMIRQLRARMTNPKRFTPEGRAIQKTEF